MRLRYNQNCRSCGWERNKNFFKARLTTRYDLYAEQIAQS